MNALPEPTAAQTSHRLVGLRPDNLLAFLSLLGALHALETARPDWHPRAKWSGRPVQLELSVSHAVSRDELIGQMVDGLGRLGERYRRLLEGLTKKNVKDYTPEEFRTDLVPRAQGDPWCGGLLAALGSDAAARQRKNSSELEQPPLCVLRGQGHQHFLRRLTNMLAPGPDVDLQRELQAALFAPWRYDEKGDGFRWDPAEYRLHAYQAGDPSDDAYKIGTVPGAQRLAAFGFALIAAAPQRNALTSLGVFRRIERRMEGRMEQVLVCWPLVGVPTGLTGHLALLAHPALGDEKRALELAPYGVLAVARARRYAWRVPQGEYVNFGHARLQYLG